MRQAWETMVAFKLVWVRVLGYFAVPTWLMWEALTKDLSGAAWDGMHSFERFLLIGKCIAAGFIAFMAFIDQSMHRATENLEKKRNGNTQHFTRSDTGP